MSIIFQTLPRYRSALDFLAVVAVGYFLKVGLDEFIWRYSGPVSLVIQLVLIFGYLRWRGASWSWIGLVPLNSRRKLMLLPLQTFLAFIAIPVSGLALGFGGEAIGLDFMKPDASGAENRFGDLAGNTPLYMTWVAILWIAGPAEELYFRGFMIGQLREVLGSSIAAKALSILVPAVIFGIGHTYYLGLRGLVMTGGIGLTLGILYLLYRRNIWPLMVAHAAFNTLTFTARYLQWDI